MSYYYFYRNEKRAELLEKIKGAFEVTVKPAYIVNVLKILRLTQNDLAERSGLTKQSISAMVTGKRPRVSLKSLEAITDAILDVAIERGLTPPTITDMTEDAEDMRRYQR